MFENLLWLCSFLTKLNIFTNDLNNDITDQKGIIFVFNLKFCEYTVLALFNPICFYNITFYLIMLTNEAKNKNIQQ